MQTGSLTYIKVGIKCCEVFFETLNSPGLCVQSQSVLSLYGSGFTTGISVDLGHDTADIVPVYEGGLISYAHMQTHYASVDISKFIKDSFDERNIGLDIHAEEVLDGIKKNLYLTQNVAMSRKNYRRTYVLPSGEEIDISQEAFMAAEMMIQPVLVKGYETEVMPLQEAVVTCAMKCDAELRPELYDAVVPCGGVSMIPGLNERLATEIENITNKPVTVLSSPEAYAVSWLGGATFAGMPASKKMWVSKKQYEDYGEKIVRNKFM
ncbi:actin-like [Ostrinia furnacalis]|uniref:actin-like n=1 Tax=Ostrinia furnacalis TaxID=93504 RepID=UPI00103D8AFC|nr:actin-like [Ostrinia furnacalis]